MSVPVGTIYEYEIRKKTPLKIQGKDALIGGMVGLIALGASRNFL